MTLSQAGIILFLMILMIIFYNEPIILHSLKIKRNRNDGQRILINPIILLGTTLTQRALNWGRNK